MAVVVESDGTVKRLGLLGPFLLQRLEQELRQRSDDPLAHTGGGSDAILALVAIGFLVVGAVALVLARRPPPSGSA
jgi:hypothetical protein